MPGQESPLVGFRDRYRTAVAKNSISIEEALILEVLRLSPVPQSAILDKACAYSLELPQFAPVNRVVAADALKSCFHKRWIWVVTLSSLRDITGMILSSGVIGPIYGLPNVGDIDFTQQGGTLYHDVVAQFYPHANGYEQRIECREHRIYSSLTAAATELKECVVSDMSQKVTRTGPWRRKWWERFSDGILIEVEQ